MPDENGGNNGSDLAQFVIDVANNNYVGSLIALLCNGRVYTVSTMPGQQGDIVQVSIAPGKGSSPGSNLQKFLNQYKNIPELKDNDIDTIYYLDPQNKSREVHWEFNYQISMPDANTIWSQGDSLMRWNIDISSGDVVQRSGSY